MSMDAIKKIDADKKRAEKEAAKVAAKAEKERLKAEAKVKPPEQGFAHGGMPHSQHPAASIPGFHIVGHNPIFHGDE